MAALKWLAALALLAAAHAAPAEITYVELASDPCPTSRCDALGYPVPLPVASQTPVAGFRDYASLQARLMGLAAGSDALRAETIGRTRDDRAIQAYVLSTPADTRPGGPIPKAAVMQNGGIHAREWQSPEVVTGLIERVMAQRGDAGFHQFLLDNLRMVLIPVLNVDGFLQTQRYPDRALETAFPGDPADWPRDGRMRRKNLRDTDEDLATTADFLSGVDLNRNNTPYWASSTASSGDPRSLVYHSDAAASEPEIQALYAAAALAPAARLRLYIDSHSFTRAFLAANTGNTRRDAIQRELALRISAVTGNRYCYDDDNAACNGNPTPAGFGIGSTDEHFAYSYQIPSYTLEIEPGLGGGAEYGGTGVTHSGFILPAAEIPRVRDELAEALLLGYYRQAGPPAVAAVELRRADDNSIVFSGQWTAQSATTRRFDVAARSALVPGTAYRLWLAFDKPMRARDAAGVRQYRGQSVPLAPALGLAVIAADGGETLLPLNAGAGDWRGSPGGTPDGYARYADDAISLAFTLPAGVDVSGARRISLVVDAQDLSGQQLDADPATVIDWQNGAWSGYENDAGQATDSGGSDRTIRFKDDGAPVFGGGGSASGGSGGGGTLGLGLLIVGLLAGLRRR